MSKKIVFDLEKLSDTQSVNIIIHFRFSTVCRMP